MSAAIKLEQLTKTYSSRSGPVSVVDHIDLEVGEGEIFGFLGPNGAGKTTTIKMLLSIIYPSAGNAWVLGKELGDIAIHRELSYLPEKPYYYEHMTGNEILHFYGKLFGIKEPTRSQRVKALLDKVGLGDAGAKTISKFSKGMQQRIGLAQSLLNEPKLLFLDEPTGGLDPIAHIEIRDLILQMRDEGKTVFISSHELSDVERICDRVAIINHGKIIEEGKLDDLLKGGRVEITAEGATQGLADKLKAEGLTTSFSGSRLILDVEDSKPTDGVLDAIRTAGASVVSMIPRRKRLEDLFVETITTAREAAKAEVKK